jgi:hypothetical protein
MGRAGQAPWRHTAVTRLGYNGDLGQVSSTFQLPGITFVLHYIFSNRQVTNKGNLLELNGNLFKAILNYYHEWVNLLTYAIISLTSLLVS